MTCLLFFHNKKKNWLEQIYYNFLCMGYSTVYISREESQFQEYVNIYWLKYGI